VNPQKYADLVTYCLREHKAVAPSDKKLMRLYRDIQKGRPVTIIPLDIKKREAIDSLLHVIKLEYIFDGKACVYSTML